MEQPAPEPLSWTPTATPEMEVKILPILTEIADACLRLEAKDSRQHPHYLGAAMFLGYLSCHRDFKDRREQAENMFGLAVESAGESPGPALFGGYVELGWYAAHLGALLGWDVDDLCNSLDELVLDVLSTKSWDGKYDLIGGLVGIGVYGAERGSRLIMAAVLTHLEQLAVPMRAGITWPTPPSILGNPNALKDSPFGVYDCGVAHGTAGVIALLATMMDQGVEPDRSSVLLHQATQWLVSCRQAPSCGSLLPHWIPIGLVARPDDICRIAWCYGDLGASMALFLASDITKDIALRRFAMDLAHLASARPLGESGVIDAALCHGSIGNAHIFGRIFNSTKNRIFLKSAQRYIDFGLKFHQPGKGFGGFSPGPVAGVHVDDHCFLTGGTGVGLGLLAAVSDLNPGWDRTLLMSARRAKKAS